MEPGSGSATSGSSNTTALDVGGEVQTVSRHDSEEIGGQSHGDHRGLPVPELEHHDRGSVLASPYADPATGGGHLDRLDQLRLARRSDENLRLLHNYRLSHPSSIVKYKLSLP